jgi:hypothetical protein
MMVPNAPQMYESSCCCGGGSSTGGSDLYTQYPPKELRDKEDTNPVRRGWFEDLYIGQRRLRPH